MSAQAQSPARYIYLAASKLRDPVTRNEYLDEACGSDLELRKQLNRLLDADDEDTDSPLQAAIDELGNDTGAEPVRRGFHGTAASGEANTDSTQLDETTACRSDFSEHRVIGRYKLLGSVLSGAASYRGHSTLVS